MKQAVHRPVRAVIQLDVLEKNIHTIRQHLPKNTQFFAVVKADAYGHGAIEIARKAESCGVDGFCVAMLDEAIALRKAGIKVPILVLGVTQPQHAPLFIEHSISATVDSVDFLREVVTYIETGVLSVHLALNTGMNRLGMNNVSDIQLFDQLMMENDCLQLDGVFTHIATADGEDDNRVEKQYQLFHQLLQGLSKRPRYVHLANSAMSLWRQQYESDIARVGIAMYGLNPSDYVLPLPVALQPVLALETEIVHVHLLKQGEAVSYGAKYIAKKDEWIATLPIGYADGWRRDLGKQGVYINGEKCDIVGVVCMDQMMIRLPKQYPVGTVVELIGPHQTATDLAVSIGTIGYEILCGISERVTRVYVD